MYREVGLAVLIAFVLLAVGRCASPNRVIFPASVMPIVSPPVAHSREYRPSYCTNPAARGEARCKATAVKWM
jgi:hypothetical protein